MVIREVSQYNFIHDQCYNVLCKQAGMVGKPKKGKNKIIELIDENWIKSRKTHKKIIAKLSSKIKGVYLKRVFNNKKIEMHLDDYLANFLVEYERSLIKYLKCWKMSIVWVKELTPSQTSSPLVDLLFAYR